MNELEKRKRIVKELGVYPMFWRNLELIYPHLPKTKITEKEVVDTLSNLIKEGQIETKKEFGESWFRLNL